MVGDIFGTILVAADTLTFGSISAGLEVVERAEQLAEERKDREIRQKIREEYDKIRRERGE